MTRIITILLAAIVIVAIGQDSPRPSLSALDNVRNLVASMRQESIAARELPDGQMRPHPDWYRHASGCPLDDWSPNAPAQPRREGGVE